MCAYNDEHTDAVVATLSPLNLYIISVFTFNFSKMLTVYFVNMPYTLYYIIQSTGDKVLTESTCPGHCSKMTSSNLAA